MKVGDRVRIREGAIVHCMSHVMRPYKAIGDEEAVVSYIPKIGSKWVRIDAPDGSGMRFNVNRHDLIVVVAAPEEPILDVAQEIELCLEALR